MEFVVSVAAKVAEYLVAPITHPFTYCCTYKTNFEKLNNEVDKLKNARESVQYKVDDSRIKGDGIQQHVEEWLIAADKVINEVETLIEDKQNSNDRCLKGLCPNLRTRYELSKKAEREANAIVGLHEKGRFDSVSFRTIPEETWLSSTQGFMHFESRKFTLKEILDALSNRNFNMIGVYGMGGIGKTTLVKEVGRQVKENNLCEKVISAHVSRTPQIKEIQREIAEKIGLELAEQSHETVRAGRLLERLKKEKKILIILDDIWGSLDLEAIGIPLADDNSGRKVLLTSRSVDVLSCKMDCQQNFRVDVLNGGEAWSLFTKTTGDCIENDELRSVAKDIVKECAGLPIAIVPVARALRNQRLCEWKDALLELRRPSLRNFSGTLEVAYKSIELSYSHLNEELKSTFLLIRYAFISCVEDVRFYGMGLGLFQNINTLEEARDRAHTLVDKLKKSCLLLDGNTSERFFMHDGNTSERFSMHDVVRDVAISVASRDQHVFAVENEVVPLTSWPDKDALKVCRAISLFNTNISELPQGFECPQLKYFRIRSDPSLRIPDNFFTGMTELRVLDFTMMHLLALPSSLGLLQSLQTLSLDYCQLGDIAIIGDLKKLEILTLRGSDMEELVEEIGRLKQLRLLDLSSCFNLKVIPPNAISSLSRLEELNIGQSPIQWGKVGEVDGERRNASLDELNNLSKLTSLEILIQDEKTLLPRYLSFFKMLQRYRISIGYGWWSVGPSDGISRKFKLKLTNGANICLNEGHIMQLKGIEDLTLDGLPDMQNVLCELGREVFPQLKRLQIEHNGNLSCVVDTMDCTPARTTALPLLESLFLRDLRNLEEICRGPLTAESFCKLKTIEVEWCDKLKNVLSMVIGRGLQQLQSIKVSSCQNMEVIFAAERGDESSKFPLLESLFLSNLRNLEEICRGPLTAESFCKLKTIRVEGCDKLKNVLPLVIGGGLQQLQSIQVSRCQNMEVIFAAERGDESSKFPLLKSLFLSDLRNLEEICHGPLTAESFCKLKTIRVERCDKLKNVLSIVIGGGLQQLQSIKVISCQNMEVIFAAERGDESSKFPLLESLFLSDLRNLEEICRGPLTAESFCKLETIRVEGCDKLKNVLSMVIGGGLQQLQSIKVSSCQNMEVIFAAERGDESSKFPLLESLFLRDLRNLEEICGGPLTAESFCKLKTIRVEGCDKLKNVFPLVIELTQLRTLELRSLPRLTSFCTGDLHIEKVFPNLEELIVDEKHIGLFPEAWLCKLKYLDVGLDESSTILSLDDFLHRFHTIKILSVRGDNEALFTSFENLENGMEARMRGINHCRELKQVFKQESTNTNNLEQLEIFECDNLTNLVPSSTSFQNLITLTVWRCSRMIHVLTSSTARSLVRLRQMEIGCCKMITEIVADEDDEGDNYAAKDEIFFSELKELKLWDLKSLTSFSCSGNNCDFKFPSLETLVVENCPNMKIFSEGELSTPKLQKVQLSELDKKLGAWGSGP